MKLTTTEIMDAPAGKPASFAHQSDCLRSTVTGIISLNDRSEKDIDSCPESTVEDADNECEDTMNEPEHIQGFVENPVSNDSKSESAASDGVRYQIAKLVEENAQIQVELIRRNSEKRDAIRKLCHYQAFHSVTGSSEIQSC